MEVTLYSTNCARCIILETKLKQKQIDFKLVEGEEEIIKAGFKSAPILKVDNEYMEFSKAIGWINQYKG